MILDRNNQIAMDILNAKSRAENRKNFKDFCDTCKYKLSRELCRNCDGRKKYIADEE